MFTVSHGSCGTTHYRWYDTHSSRNNPRQVILMKYSCPILYHCTTVSLSSIIMWDSLRLTMTITNYYITKFGHILYLCMGVILVTTEKRQIRDNNSSDVTGRIEERFTMFGHILNWERGSRIYLVPSIHKEVVNNVTGTIEEYVCGSIQEKEQQICR